ncbi:glycerol ethanol, ferric requiring protein [Actinomortierella wolfii]|nr:glycerol ethanol, ferric requiring protein [Actinomortierella wolfii]
MQSPQDRLLGPIRFDSFQSFLDRFPAPLNQELFNEPTGYEKALQEVKQYEDFTTIGIVIGLNAAFIAICTGWLSDLKLGRCKFAWWLNQKFCCWGVDSEDGSCDDWQPWSNFAIINYVYYLVFATTFAASAAFLVKKYAPYAAGSGISEIKCILAGFIMKGYLGGWTLVIKSLCLAMSVAANLSVGKEGPSIHIACCAGHVISRLFPKYQRSRAKSREIISASAAAGVAVAFGAPIGGVLFSFEEMNNHFPAKTMWRSFFCALVGTVTLQYVNPYRTGKLVMFQVSYDRDWHFFEIIFFIILGIFGGLYGAFIIKYNLKVQQVRKKYLGKYGVIEAATLAFFTCTFAYWNIFMRIDMAESMNILFRECAGSEDYMGLCQPQNTWKMVALLFFALVTRIFTCTITYGLKVPAGIFVPSMAIGALFGRMVGLMVRAAQTAYPGFMLFSSCKPDVPCITPGTYAFLGAAAALGGVMRLTLCVVIIMFELTGALNYILPTMITLMVTQTVGDYFAKGGIADRYIRLNGYPFLDKEEHSFGIAVSQVMQKDVTVLPASGTRLDRVQRLLADTNYQGFPVVEDSTSRTLIGYIGRSELRYVIEKASRSRPISPMAHCFFRPGSSEARLHMDNSMAGGPGRGGLEQQAEVASRRFSSASLSGSTMSDGHSGAGVGYTGGEGHSAAETNESNVIDFGPFIDQTPITVHPKLPLETVMEIFKQMGPRVILIEHFGKLMGLITVKDLLKYIARTEALEEEEEDDEDPYDERLLGGGHERRGSRNDISAFDWRGLGSRLTRSGREHGPRTRSRWELHIDEEEGEDEDDDMETGGGQRRTSSHPIRSARSPLGRGQGSTATARRTSTRGSGYPLASSPKPGSMGSLMDRIELVESQAGRHARTSEEDEDHDEGEIGAIRR